MALVSFRSGWRRKDAVLESDARAFISRLGSLPQQQNIDMRVEELCAAAYDGNEMIALSTAVIQEVDVVKCRLAMSRCAVDSRHAQRGIKSQTLVYARKILEVWSLENPEEQLMGLGLLTPSKGFSEREEWRAMMRPAMLGLAGFTDKDEALRIAWFEHATIPNAKLIAGPED